MTTSAFIDASEAPPRATGQIKLHGPEAFEGMRKAGQLAAQDAGAQDIGMGRDLARVYLPRGGADLAAPSFGSLPAFRVVSRCRQTSAWSGFGSGNFET